MGSEILRKVDTEDTGTEKSQRWGESDPAGHRSKKPHELHSEEKVHLGPKGTRNGTEKCLGLSARPLHRSVFGIGTGGASAIYPWGH